MTSAITFGMVNSNPDILDQTRFLLDFGNIPLSGGNTAHLAVKCINVPLPGLGQEDFRAPMHGFNPGYRGRPTWPGTVAPTFYEDRKMLTLKVFRGWKEFTAGSESGNSGGYKEDYAINVSCIIFDTMGVAINSHLIENMRIQDVPDVTFDGTSSAPVQVAPTFAYDRISWGAGSLL